MNLYLPSGYLNVAALMSLVNIVLFIIIGGRGTGKTYGILKWMRDNKKTPMFIRRTQAQADIVGTEGLSPWKSIALDDNFSFKVEKVAKGVTATYEVDDDDNKIRPLFYCAALSTFSNLRGFDATDIDYIVFDEFIPETHERPIKNEADTFLNTYETINRNRELKGLPPVKIILMANANRLDSPLLMGLGFINKIEQMIKNKQQISILPEKSSCIALLHDSPISEMKKDTFIYKLTKGTQFEQMAVNNDFSYSDTTGVVSRPLQGMTPLFSMDNMTVYENRQSNKLYVSNHNSGSKRKYVTTSEEDLKRLQNDCFFMTINILANNIEYETFEIKAKVLSVFLTN